MARHRRVFLALWVSLLISPCIEASDYTFVVSGTLVRDDRSLIEGARVMIAEAKETGFALNIGEAVENPSVITDERGRFSITVRRSLFKDRKEFVVVVPLFAGTPSRRPARAATV